MHTLTAHPLLRRAAVAIATAALAALVIAPLAAVGIAGAQSTDPHNNTGTDDTSGQDIVRVAGGDRYETAAEVALGAFPEGTTDILYIANGETGHIDALAVGVTNERVQKMLLVKRDEIPAATVNVLEQLRSVNRVVILGGEEAVSADVEQQIDDILGDALG